MKSTKEILEYFGPPLPPDYEPPGLWAEWDARELEPRVPAKCAQLELFAETGT